MNQTPNQIPSQTTINPAAAVLWASAFVIAALIILQAGRLPGGGAAYGDMTTDRGTYSVMTADSGRGGDEDPDEILYVIDSRDQVLLVYDIEDPRRGQIVLRDGYGLDGLFMRARQ